MARSDIAAERTEWLQTDDGKAWTKALNDGPRPAVKETPLEKHESRHPESGYTHPAPVEKGRRRLGGH